MREFFGLIVFAILLCLWSWVFADSDDQSNVSEITAPVAIEMKV